MARVFGGPADGSMETVDPDEAWLRRAIARTFAPSNEGLSAIERSTLRAFRTADRSAQRIERRSRPTPIRAGHRGRSWLAFGAAMTLGLALLAQAGAGRPSVTVLPGGYHDAVHRSPLPDSDATRPAQCGPGSVLRRLPGVSSEEGRDPDHLRRPRLCPSGASSPPERPGDLPP